MRMVPLQARVKCSGVPGSVTLTMNSSDKPHPFSPPAGRTVKVPPSERPKTSETTQGRCQRPDEPAIRRRPCKYVYPTRHLLQPPQLFEIHLIGLVYLARQKGNQDHRSANGQRPGRSKKTGRSPGGMNRPGTASIQLSADEGTALDSARQNAIRQPLCKHLSRCSSVTSSSSQQVRHEQAEGISNLYRPPIVAGRRTETEAKPSP
jgi:hypothetical protein